MKFRTVFLCCILIFVLPALAHEFWLEPQQYIFSRGEEINIRFKVGEQFHGDNWKGSREKINDLRLYYGDVMDSSLSSGITDEKGDSLQFSLFEETTVMVCFNSTNNFIELDSAKFTEYLKEDGLTNALEYRKEHNETDSMGREYYQRSVKTIVQVGANKTDVYKKQTSLPLDIIPLAHPYMVHGKQKMNVKVLFHNEPLINHKIVVWHKMADGVTDSSYTSNANGEISFIVDPAGEWMVSCVNMIRLENDAKAQWQSYWGSCTWGYTGRHVVTDRSR
ncbi:MAG: DUF4198 domain-containing protein [Chitinophagaceae bacterium]|nr:DUF4198 domain-containing protein [Chitinophagaceae bacterium]